MTNLILYEKEFLNYVRLIFYANRPELNYSSFIIDFEEKETAYYFFQSFIKYCQSNIENCKLTMNEVICLYYKFSRYNMRMFEKDNPEGDFKFEITKQAMLDCMEMGLIPKVEYKVNTEGVVRKKMDNLLE